MKISQHASPWGSPKFQFVKFWISQRRFLGPPLAAMMLSTSVRAELNTGTEDDNKSAVSETDSTANYKLVDWTAIRMNSKWVYKKARLQGFLSFDGNGDYPTITLWETNESMRHRKAFFDVHLATESASKLINDRFGWGTENWKAMEGLFVEVTGEFERQEEGRESLGLGRLEKIWSIEVMNNGFVLFALSREKATPE